MRRKQNPCLPCMLLGNPQRKARAVKHNFLLYGALGVGAYLLYKYLTAEPESPANKLLKQVSAGNPFAIQQFMQEQSALAKQMNKPVSMLEVTRPRHVSVAT